MLETALVTFFPLAPVLLRFLLFPSPSLRVDVALDECGGTFGAVPHLPPPFHPLALHLLTTSFQALHSPQNLCLCPHCGAGWLLPLSPPGTLLGTFRAPDVCAQLHSERRTWPPFPSSIPPCYLLPILSSSASFPALRPALLPLP